MFELDTRQLEREQKTFQLAINRLLHIIALVISHDISNPANDFTINSS